MIGVRAGALADSVTVAEDAAAAVSNVENAHVATRLLAQSALRNVLGARPLAEMLSARDAISAAMQVTLDEATEPWGIQSASRCALTCMPHSHSHYSLE